MKLFVSLSILTCALASGGTLYVPAYPNDVLVVDDTNGKVLDTIPLSTGLPTGIRLSNDKKTLFVTTNDHSGVEVIDIATRKVTNHFVLNDEMHRYRLNGAAPDPDGKILYATTTEILKKSDRFEIGKPKYTVIDLAQQKIVKTVDSSSAQGETPDAGGGNGGGAFEVSPDGKYLYQFRNQVIVLKAEDFSVVEKIDLGRPEDPTVDSLSLGGMLEALSEPGQRVSLFNFSDPIIHAKSFGLAKFDLNTRKFEYTPVGPAPVSMTNLRITPDKKMGYTVITNGTGGNKRCEVWGLDLSTSKLAKTSDIPCRSRYSFGISTDGKKLYMYGAGFEIDVYDAVTFQHEATWDLGHDMRGGMVGLP
jgi:DNA-binding beta-propeller fold protein YncE